VIEAGLRVPTGYICMKYYIGTSELLQPPDAKTTDNTTCRKY
jgi:hypothetical protein